MPDWIEGDALAHGVRLHYYRTGGDRAPTPNHPASAPQGEAERVKPVEGSAWEPDKPSVVLLHGMTDNALCWRRVAQRLEPDYDVLMLDARGHGQSDAPPSGYTAEDHAPDVAGLIDALGLNRPVLVGHSMGAATAAATAAHFPEHVRALILEDPPWGRTIEVLTDEQRRARIADWRAGILKRKTQSLAEIAAYGRHHNPTWDESEFEDWAMSKQQTSPLIAGDIAGRGVRWQDVMRLVRCPVLLITADPERNAIVRPETVAEAQALCPTLTTVHIAGAGHNIRREQFEPFMQAVSAYLMGCGA